MPSSVTPRLARLDNRLQFAGLFVLLMAIFLGGALRSPFSYGSAAYVIDYFETELLAALVLLLTTALLYPTRHIGLRWPERTDRAPVWPVLLLMIVAMVAWVMTRLSLPPGSAADNAQSLLILRTTAVVGLNEEWIFRGLLLAVLSRWLGLRNGAFLALIAFGGFHLINIAAGVPPLASLIQFANTIVLGSIFLMAAIGSRSLLLPMVAHALYDFAVIDMARLGQAGADAQPILAPAGLGLVLGLWCLYRTTRLSGGEPYPV